MKLKRKLSKNKPQSMKVLPYQWIYKYEFEPSNLKDEDSQESYLKNQDFYLNEW